MGAKNRHLIAAERRATAVRQVAIWMRDAHPTCGIDSLLTRPLEAARMALAVATVTGWIYEFYRGDYAH